MSGEPGWWRSAYVPRRTRPGRRQGAVARLSGADVGSGSLVARTGFGGWGGLMNRSWWTLARLGGGGVVLAVLVWRLGTGPFRAGLRSLDAWAVLAALALGAVATACYAWRWRRVAEGLGVGMPLGTAFAAYYRSQLINSTLPGGVVGDVHRAVSHGRSAGDLPRGLRAAAWERGAGQLVQITVAVVALAVLPSPLRHLAPAAAVAVLLATAGGLLLLRGREGGTGRLVRALCAARTDLRDGLLARRAWPVILLASVGAVTAHVATFVIAARTAGVSAPPARLLPLALLVLVATAVPTNVGGWGPREGAAAWAFGAAGLGASAGLATAVVYGVLSMAATLPGVAVLLIGWLRRPRRATAPTSPTVPTPAAAPVAAVATPAGVPLPAAAQHAVPAQHAGAPDAAPARPAGVRHPHRDSGAARRLHRAAAAEGAARG
jgi:glycosyltransferase 2 family protein